jgi:transposase
MTDGQWALLAPLLPAACSTGGRGGRPKKWDRRLVLDAIFSLARDNPPVGPAPGHHHPDGPVLLLQPGSARPDRLGALTR